MLRSTLLYIISLIIVGGLLGPSFVFAKEIDSPFPRIANYYLPWKITRDEAYNLARWDLLILDMELAVTSPEKVRLIRRLNPNVIILAYITPQEILRAPTRNSSLLRRRIAREVSDRWYLKDIHKQKLYWWPNTHLFNIADPSFIEYMTNFVSDDVLGSGIWDGVMLDNAWDGIRWAVGDDLDIDSNGTRDLHADTLWANGMRALYEGIRGKTNNEYFIIGNSDRRTHLKLLDGKMIEGFNRLSWKDGMQLYTDFETQSGNGGPTLINHNGSYNDYPHMRFGLVSTLLRNGFYSYDVGPESHQQLWWYDEYNVDLGSALDPPTVTKNTRYFQSGVVVVNPTKKEQTVSLSADYEHLHGTQDPRVNNGRIVRSVTLSPLDGLLLLKPIETIHNVMIPNGAFIRFFESDGSRARNALFVHDRSFKNGETFGYIDIDKDRSKDTLRIKGPRLIATRSDKQPLLKKIPFGFTDAKMYVTTGDIFDSKPQEILSWSDSDPTIRIYSKDGIEHPSFFPFGHTYTGGYSIATTHNKNTPLLVIGSGAGASDDMYVFAPQQKGMFRQVMSWSIPAHRGTKRVDVASGDILGDQKDEIVSAFVKNKRMYIHIFSQNGEKLKSFDIAYNESELKRHRIRVHDVDQDGKDEILVISSGFTF